MGLQLEVILTYPRWLLSCFLFGYSNFGIKFFEKTQNYFIWRDIYFLINGSQENKENIMIPCTVLKETMSKFEERKLDGRKLLSLNLRYEYILYIKKISSFKKSSITHSLINSHNFFFSSLQNLEPLTRKSEDYSPFSGVVNGWR